MPKIKTVRGIENHKRVHMRIGVIGVGICFAPSAK